MDGREASSLIWDIATRVQNYTGGSIGWTAKQAVSEHQPYNDLYGFIVGEGFASVRLSDAVNADDALIRQLATDILGYAPGSIEDLSVKKQNALSKVVELTASIRREAEALMLYQTQYRELDEKIESLRQMAVRP